MTACLMTGYLWQSLHISSTENTKHLFAGMPKMSSLFISMVTVWLWLCFSFSVQSCKLLTKYITFDDKIRIFWLNDYFGTLLCHIICLYVLIAYLKTNKHVSTEAIWSTHTHTHTLLQLLTETHHMVFDRCSTAPLCCSPGPVYTPHRCSRPFSWPPSPWCPHSLRDTSWYKGRSQCKTFTEHRDNPG